MVTKARWKSLQGWQRKPELAYRPLITSLLATVPFCVRSGQQIIKGWTDTCQCGPWSLVAMFLPPNHMRPGRCWWLQRTRSRQVESMQKAFTQDCFVTPALLHYNINLKIIVDWADHICCVQCNCRSASKPPSIQWFKQFTRVFAVFYSFVTLRYNTVTVTVLLLLSSLWVHGRLVQTLLQRPGSWIPTLRSMPWLLGRLQAGCTRMWRLEHVA